MAPVLLFPAHLLPSSDPARPPSTLLSCLLACLLSFLPPENERRAQNPKRALGRGRTSVVEPADNDATASRRLPRSPFRRHLRSLNEGEGAPAVLLRAAGKTFGRQCDRCHGRRLSGLTSGGASFLMHLLKKWRAPTEHRHSESDPATPKRSLAPSTHETVLSRHGEEENAGRKRHCGCSVTAWRRKDRRTCSKVAARLTLSAAWGENLSSRSILNASRIDKEVH